MQPSDSSAIIEFHLTWFTIGPHDLANETAYSQSM
jgi:hypothetical protein